MRVPPKAAPPPQSAPPRVYVAGVVVALLIALFAAFALTQPAQEVQTEPQASSDLESH